jgi:hypothetical protein
VGLHTDNGLLRKDGLVGNGDGYTQEPESAVAIVMWGDCAMDMILEPWAVGVDSRPPQRFPLPGGGAVMLLAHEDDCRCKHALELSDPRHVNVGRMRIALVLRQLRWTRHYYADTNKLVLSHAELEHIRTVRRERQRTKRRLFGS